MKTHRDLVRSWTMVTALVLGAAGCTATTSSTADSPDSTDDGAGDPGAGNEVAKKESTVVADEEDKGPQLVHTLKDVGLEAPEAIIHDEEADVYLVSNVNGQPLAEDKNGFISRVGPDGKVEELKWIDGQKPGVTLNAPKGMALSKGFLYVSDITWIRVFDRKTGEPKGKVFAKGATFLNDVATNEKGEIVFSDTGWKAGKEGFGTTGSDAVFRINPKTVKSEEIARSKDLGNPNGLAMTKEGLWVVNDQGELFLLGKDGKKEQTTKLAKGGLDGVVALDDGSFLVSSWKGSAIYHGKPGGKFEVLVGDLKSPASIGYDSKRGRVLVPKMMENQALIYDLSGGGAGGQGKSEGNQGKSEAAKEKAAKKKAAKADEKAAKAEKKEAKKAAKADEKAKTASKKAEPKSSKESDAAKPSKAATPAKPAEPGKKGEAAKPAEPAKPASKK